MKVDIEDIKRIVIQPGELLVVRVKTAGLPEELVEQRMMAIRGAFEHIIQEGAQVLVADENMDMSVFQKPEETKKGKTNGKV